MLAELIVILSLNVIFYEGENGLCGENSNGCIVHATKTIYLDFESDNINRTLHHEIGHAIFDRDRDVKSFSNDKEDIAKQYAQYKINPQFSIKHPSLYLYFQDIEQDLLNNGVRKRLPARLPVN